MYGNPPGQKWLYVVVANTSGTEIKNLAEFTSGKASILSISNAAAKRTIIIPAHFTDEVTNEIYGYTNK